MKEFNTEKFCNDLVSLRRKESSDIFARKLGVKISDLSLLEKGRLMPTIDLLNKVCALTGASANDYFTEMTTDSLGNLMSGLEESDKLKIREMVEHIRIREKYEMLAMRGENGFGTT